MKKLLFVFAICCIIFYSCSSADDECGCYDVTLEANNLTYTVYLCDNPDIERYENVISPQVAEDSQLRAREEGHCK